MIITYHGKIEEDGDKGKSRKKRVIVWVGT
jgi:hypothetical protein